ncbi:hypothetical protein MTR67_000652 [Solanum verrucosum]|uniref:Uncharacterized protein n=1 Tax=Solanum verrucosum TaxID=315347 RepID=A0AAF0T4D1_SOLVR|nr:hypothetical protein MTR67_000652 [Solanum verrucosum]
MSATSRLCGNYLGLFLSPIDQKPWLLLFCVSFVPKQTTKLHQSRMTATSKSACLLPRGLDRRISVQNRVHGLNSPNSVLLHWSGAPLFNKEKGICANSFVPLPEIHSLSDRLRFRFVVGRERKDRKLALTRLPFVSCFWSGVAVLFPILVLDFQLHSSEEEDSKSPPVVILLGLGVESLSFV